MSEVFVPMHVKPDVREAVERLRDHLKAEKIRCRSYSDAVMVAVVAFDVTYGTRHGGAFTDAVRKVLEETNHE